MLSDNSKELALAFISHLHENDMTIERFTYHGEDTLHWEVRFQGHIVCYILLDAEKSEWTILPDNSSTSRFAEYEADDCTKGTAWKNLNICNNGHCGGCGEGTGARRLAFGREIDHVCGMAYNFTNPDAMALKLAILMVDVRKKDCVKTR